MNKKLLLCVSHGFFNGFALLIWRYFLFRLLLKKTSEVFYLLIKVSVSLLKSYFNFELKFKVTNILLKSRRFFINSFVSRTKKNHPPLSSK